MSSFEIPQVKALVKRPQREQAQQLLEWVANQVLPILTQRKFSVRALHEFFPKDPRLLGININKGLKIYIRLRPASGGGSGFLPREALLETMLHELTHMVHGPHNAAFYKCFETLKSEMETLMLRGLTGLAGVQFGQAGEGHVLGGGRSALSGPSAAVRAAERRRKYQQLIGSEFARRLGNGQNSVPMDVDVSLEDLRLKVLAAAEQRRKDQERCSVADSITQAFEIIGIDSDDDDVQEVGHQETRAPAAVPGTVSPDATIKSDDDGAPNIVDLAAMDDAPAPRPRKRKRDRAMNQETKASAADPANTVDLTLLDEDDEDD